MYYAWWWNYYHNNNNYHDNIIFSLSIIQLEGSYLSLRGNIIANNSYLSIVDIGDRSNGQAALLCVTDISQCCNRRMWLFPNGSEIITNGGRIYSNTDTIGTLSLNRRNNAMAPSGLYCCKAINTNGNITKICANISKSSYKIISVIDIIIIIFNL